MTYCWEEYDLGPAGAPTTPSGNAPIFRSFNPVTSPTRIFPKITDLLNNTSTIGEILPTYTRNLTFRLSVRDNRTGGGGVDWKQIAFNVDGNSGPFVVTAPNTNVSWTGNSTQTVTWSVASTNVSPVNCSNVRILLSTDGGYNFNTVLLASTPNDGSQQVDIPNLPTTQARIKVEAVGNIFFDLSNVNFTIINNPGISNPVSFIAAPVSSAQIDIAFTPNASNNNVVIVWNTTGIFTTPGGAPPAVGQSFAGGTLIYNGTTSPVTHSGLTALSSYYYKAFSYNGSSYSSGSISNAATFSIDDPSLFSAGAISSSEIYVGFATNIVGDNVVIVWNNSGTFSSPIGIPPAAGQPFAGGTLLYSGILSPQLHSGLVQATDYYYKAYSYDGYNYSSGLNANATTATATATFQLTVSVSNGWNMVSIPGLHPTNQDVTTWWSGKDPTAGVFRFSTGYSLVTSATPGQGYWMKNLGANTYNTGDEWPAGGILTVFHDPIAGTAGWNLIGGYETNVLTENISTIPSGLQTGSVFQYSSGYTVATNLVPGYGYWIKLTGPGAIDIPNALVKGPAKSTEVNTSDWGKIVITDNSGKSYILYAVKRELNLDDYELPPAPPSGMFDVRYGSGRYAEDLSSGSQSIEMQGIDYPIKIRVEKMDIRLSDATGKGLNQSLKSGDEVTISNSSISKLLVTEDLIPEIFSLEQNYPNPFNPSTNINFSVPKQTHIKINLYNMLGEFLQTITEGLYEAGYYQTEFSAKNLPSGIYIYRMENGESLQSKKMILIR